MNCAIGKEQQLIFLENITADIIAAENFAVRDYLQSIYKQAYEATNEDHALALTYSRLASHFINKIQAQDAELGQKLLPQIQDIASLSIDANLNVEKFQNELDLLDKSLIKEVEQLNKINKPVKKAKVKKNKISKKLKTEKQYVESFGYVFHKSKEGIYTVRNNSIAYVDVYDTDIVADDLSTLEEAIEFALKDRTNNSELLNPTPKSEPIDNTEKILELEGELNALEAERKELEGQLDLDPEEEIDINSYALLNWHKISPESAEGEVLATKRKKKGNINKSLLSKDGLSVQGAAHKMMESSATWDESEFREEIINILASGKPLSALRNENPIFKTRSSIVKELDKITARQDDLNIIYNYLTDQETNSTEDTPLQNEKTFEDVLGEGVDILSEETTESEDVKESIAVEEFPVKETPVEKANSIVEENQVDEVIPALSGLTEDGNMTADAKNEWDATPSTLFADQARTGERPFHDGVKAKLMQNLENQAGSKDSRKDEIYFTIKPVSEVENAVDVKPEDEFLIVVTDKDGNALKFNTETYEVSGEGKVAYFFLKDPLKYINSKGEKTQDFNNTVDSLVRLKTTQELNKKKLSKEELDVLRKKFRAQAEQEVLIEVERVKEIIEFSKNNPSKQISLYAYDNSRGYLETGMNKRSPLSALSQDFTLNFVDKALAGQSFNGKDSFLDKEDVPYITVEGVRQQILVERPPVSESKYKDLIQKLLFEDVQEGGKSLPILDRVKFLRNFVNARIADDASQGKRADIYLVKNENAALGYDVYLTTGLDKFKNIELVTPDNQDQLFNKLLNRRNASGKFKHFKLHINNDYINNTVFENVEINENNEINRIDSSYNNFLKDAGFEIWTQQIEDGKIKPSNPYFKFKTTEQSDQLMSPVSEEQVTDQEYKENVDNQSDLDSDNFLDNIDNDSLFKLLTVKNGDLKATKKQIQEAKEWYQNNPLSKVVPFTILFHMVNSKGTSVASFNRSGITLFKGSDYSDLYHEAWHGFTQGILTKSEKKELYNEVRTKEGSFKDFEGKSVEFSEASDLQVEEYLAEEFRSYMLTGKKSGKGSPKKNKLFRKIWNLLKNLFADIVGNEISTNPSSNLKVEQLFEKLKVGEFDTNSFSSENFTFDSLNQGIIGKAQSNQAGGLTYLNFQNSKVVTDLIDNLISEFIDLKNTGLSAKHAKELVNLKISINNLSGKAKEDVQTRINALEKKTDYRFTKEITKNKKILSLGYEYARIRMGEIRNDLKTKHAQETDLNKINSLQKDIDILEFAINEENFGNTEDLNSNSMIAGEYVNVLAYHMTKTGLFTEAVQDVLYDIQDQTSDSQLKNNQRSGDFGKSDLSMEEMAKAEILYLLKILPKVERVNGNVERIVDERFGTTQLVDFYEVFGRLARTLEGSQNFDEMMDRLNELEKTYPVVTELKRKIGNNPYNPVDPAQEGLWNMFFQTFNKSRISLVQFGVTREISGDGIAKHISKTGVAFSSNKGVARNWDVIFKAPNDENPYISRDVEGNYYNFEAILADFSNSKEIGKRSIFEKDNIVDFYKAIGVHFSNDPELIKRLQDNIVGSGKEKGKYTPEYIFEMIKTFNDKKQIVRSVNDLLKNTTEYSNLVELESKYTSLFSNFMVTNAEGNTQYELSLNNSMTTMVNTINNTDNFLDLIELPHMKHLNPEVNPLAKANGWLQSIYILDENSPNYGKKRTHGQEKVRLKIVNLSGAIHQSKQEELNQGVSAAGSDIYTKFLTDLHTGADGVFELMRHADKGTSYGVVINGPNISQVAGYNGSRKSDNYVKFEEFQKNGNYSKATLYHVLPHLIAEMKRMRIMRNTSDSTTYDSNYLKEGKNFTAFDDIVSLEEGLKDDLIKLVEDESFDLDSLLNKKDEKQLENKIENALNKYFEGKFDENFELFSETPFITDNVKSSINIKLGGTTKNPIPNNEIHEAFVKSYTINYFINNLNSIGLFYGDLAQYKHGKEEFHKRNAGISSTGTMYRTDSLMQRIINRSYKNSYTAKNASRLGIKEDAGFTGTFKTAIVKDMNVKSVLFDELSKTLKENGKDYSKQNEADAQGFISFDAYRQLKMADSSWSDKQEDLFDKIVKGEKVDNAKVQEFFPVIKAQYWGPLANELKGLPPVTAFHKYSLFPLIPSVIKGTNAEIVHDKMTKEGISYLTFESGSKVSTITKGGEFDNLYVDNKGSRILDEKIFNGDYDNPSINMEELAFTPNEIRLEYLKDQLEIAPKDKGSVVFSTQLRKLIEDGLFENGVPKDFEKDMIKSDPAGRITKWKTTKDKESKSPFYKLALHYEGLIDELTEFKKNELLEEIGYKYDSKGKLVGDINKLINKVKENLSQEDLGQHHIDFLKVEKGELVHDPSLSLQAEKIEKLINALMVKKLVNQKVNGEGLIQVASTLFENLKEQQGRDFKNPTAEEKSKYGSSSLPSYMQGEDGITTAMKVKIALRGDFKHLLKHPDVLELSRTDEIKIKAENLQQDPKLTALNTLVKDNAWLDKDNNRQIITMTGVRIPVQGLNSMEFMEVYEFLDSSAGNVIIPPTEIVTKSGADFDVDKMTVMMPNISLIDGAPELPKRKKVNRTKEDVLKAIKTSQSSIREIYKEYEDYSFKKGKDRKKIEFTSQEMDLLRSNTEELERVESDIKVLNDKIAIAYNEKRPTQVEALLKEVQELYVNYSSLQATRNNLISTFNKEGWNELKKEREARLKPFKSTLAEAQRDFNALTSKPIENDLISTIKEILSLPENFVPLVTPNSTDILTGERDGQEALTEEMRDVVSDYDPYKTVQGKKGSQISPTRVLEARYNLYKHESNNIGKQVLGIGAVDNTYNTLLTRVGAYMNTQHSMNLSHNTLVRKGTEYISLSGVTSKDGKPISDIINQLINGWVDIAKEAWIFNIQGNKELSPSLLFMIQAGVPIEDAVYFLSNPIIRDYVKEQKKAKTIFAAPLGTIPKSGDRVKPNNFKAAAKKKVYEKYDITAFEYELENTETDYSEYSFFSKEALRDRAKAKEVNTEDKAIFLEFLNIQSMANGIGKLKMSTNVDTGRDISVFEALDRLNKIEEVKAEGYIPENIIVKLLGNPTNKDKKGNLKPIKGETPISSFFIQNLQVELVSKMFSIRNHSVINDFAKNITPDIAKNLYGDVATTVKNFKTDLINYIFQNELTYFDIDNADFYSSRELVKEEPGFIKAGAYVEDGKVYIDRATLKQHYENQSYSKKGTNKLSNIQNVYGLPVASISPAAFKNLAEYEQFVIEREILRSQFPSPGSLNKSEDFLSRFEDVRVKFNIKEKDVSKEQANQIIKISYEEYLRDKALVKSNNFYQLFESENTYVDNYVRLKAKYPELEREFSIMKQDVIEVDTTKKRKNLKFVNPAMTGDQIDLLYENLNDPIDGIISISKLKEVLPSASIEELYEIKEFFEYFPKFAIMQGGMTSGRAFSLNNIISYDSLLDVLGGTKDQNPIKNFESLLNLKPAKAKDYLRVYFDKFSALNKEGDRALRIRGKRYSNNISLLNLKSLDKVEKDTEDVFTEEEYLRSLFEANISKSIVTDPNNKISKAKYDNILNLLKNNPDHYLVVPKAINTNSEPKYLTLSNLLKEDIPNVIGITSIESYVPNEYNQKSGKFLNNSSKRVIKDGETGVNEELKDILDTEISSIKELQDAGKNVIFLPKGYSQDMLTLNKERKVSAPQNFLYVSEKLKEVGFINKNYLRSLIGKNSIFGALESGESISERSTEVIKKELSDQEVEWFQKFCIK